MSTRVFNDMTVDRAATRTRPRHSGIGANPARGGSTHSEGDPSGGTGGRSPRPKRW